MATEFKLPELGENINEAQVVSVMVSQGETVDAEQDVIEVETDKAVMPVPVTAAGKVTQVMVSEGDTLKVGDTILTLEAGDNGKTEPSDSAKKAQAASASESESQAPPEAEAASDAEADPPQAAREAPTAPAGPAPEDQAEKAEAQKKPDEASTPEPEHVDADVPSEAPSTAAPADRMPVFAAPSVRRFARDIGVDITQVKGTGPGGRISEDDIKRFARAGGSGAAAPVTGGGIAPPLPDFSQQGPVDRQAMSMIAKKTAQHMATCWATIPHVTLHEDVDVTDLEHFRQASKKMVEREGAKLTVTAMLVKLTVAALKQFPILNCSYDHRKQELIYKQYYHIGVAADTPRGLVVPVIRDADTKSLVQISRELGEMAAKAREGKLALEDMQGGTFTITNLGGIGCGHFTPIVNYPEVGILGIGSARQRMVEVEGEQRNRLIMPTSISFDHRVVNGADGARFLQWVKNAIEMPLGALLS